MKKKGIRFPPKYSPSTYSDPNAMDTRPDFNARRMTLEERERYIKQGLCFRCHQPGHVSRECGQSRSRTVAAVGTSSTFAPSPLIPQQPPQTPPTSAQTPTLTPSPYKGAAEAYAYMKAIYNSLPESEQTRLLSNMENSDF